MTQESTTPEVQGVGRSVIITGAASGIALAAAETLGRAGWAVVPVDKDADSLAAAADRLRQHGIDVRPPLAADIREPATARAAVGLATEDSLRLAGLVNAAATNLLGGIDTMSVDDLDLAYGINVRGTFLMMQAAIPGMRAGGGGSIVNVGSVDSFMGEEGALAYCTTKGAVLNMTRAAAMDLSGDGIRVNCLCPGIIDTPFFRGTFADSPDADAIVAAANRRQPLGVLDPAAVADAIAFLVTDASRGMTGSNLVVDGGISASWHSGPLA